MPKQFPVQILPLALTFNKRKGRNCKGDDDWLCKIATCNSAKERATKYGMSEKVVGEKNRIFTQACHRSGIFGPLLFLCVRERVKILNIGSRKGTLLVTTIRLIRGENEKGRKKMQNKRNGCRDSRGKDGEKYENVDILSRGKLLFCH